MQIFIRFAYGKVITIDVCKETTTVLHVMCVIEYQLHLPKGFKYSLVLKTRTPEIEFNQQPDSLLCLDGRVVNNDIIEFVELNFSRPVSNIVIKHQVKKDNEWEWKDVAVNNLKANSTILELKTIINNTIKLEPHKQRLLYGITELSNNNATLMSYGIDSYEVLQYALRDNKNKLQEILAVQKIIYCIQRFMEFMEVTITNKANTANEKTFIDTTMSIGEIKLTAAALLKYTSISEQTLLSNYTISIDKTEYKDSSVTVDSLIKLGKLKSGSKIALYE